MFNHGFFKTVRSVAHFGMTAAITCASAVACNAAARPAAAPPFTSGDLPGLEVVGTVPSKWSAGVDLTGTPISLPGQHQELAWRGGRFKVTVAILGSPIEAERALVRNVAMSSGAVEPGPLPGFPCPGDACWHAAWEKNACLLWMRTGAAVAKVGPLQAAPDVPVGESVQELARRLSQTLASSAMPDVNLLVEPPFAAAPKERDTTSIGSCYLSADDLPGWTISDTGMTPWPSSSATAPEGFANARRFTRRGPTLEETTLVCRLFASNDAAEQGFDLLREQEGYSDLRHPSLTDWLGGCPGDECVIYFRGEFRVAVRIGDFGYLVRHTYVPATSQGSPQTVVSESGQIARIVATRYHSQQARPNQK
jgi:hypothetical protein